jgi:plasmid stability protein
MATLYVENVPDEIYEALRKRAKANRKSIAAEVLQLLEQFVPTEQELKSRREFVRRLERLRTKASPSSGAFASAEDMVREDRSR